MNYKIFHDLRYILKKMELTSLDVFVVELLLMCDSKYLFSWGTSSIHSFLFKCRQMDKKKNLITIMNNRILG